MSKLDPKRQGRKSQAIAKPRQGREDEDEEGSEEQRAMAERTALVMRAASRGFAANVASATQQKLDEVSLVTDKRRLIGVPLLILHVEAITKKSKAKGGYLNITAQLETNEVVCFNDSGGERSGIRAQLEGIEISPDRPLLVPGGLRVSEYENEFGECETWYLSGRKPEEKVKGLRQLDRAPDVNGASRRRRREPGDDEGEPTFP